MSEYLTTEQIQALLEGTTEAPWTACAWERHPDSDVYVVGPGMKPVTKDGWIKQSNGRLISATPSLARTALKQAAQLPCCKRLRSSTDAVAHTLYFSAESVDDLMLQGIITKEDMQ